MQEICSGVAASAATGTLHELRITCQKYVHISSVHAKWDAEINREMVEKYEDEWSSNSNSKFLHT
jgi:6,7-dimethyl-8-ribityllumazine synthase